nr:transcription termination factor Rho [uncultured Blautia sp.]
MREKYESLSLGALKEIAKARGMRGISTLKKSELVERMVQEDDKERQMKDSTTSQENGQESRNGMRAGRTEDRQSSVRQEDSQESRDRQENRTFVRQEEHQESRTFSRQEPRQESRTERPPMEQSDLDSGISVSGILEVLPDGYGFIRSENYLPGENDVYVSPSQIRRFNLKTGDILRGNTRVKSQNEKFSALLYVTSINGIKPNEMRRLNFEDMTPIFPNERLHLERPGGSLAMRIVDLVSPIGKGQRGMIVSPPKAGKTTLLKDAAKSILKNSPKMHLIILLIDERPEEVTDIREAIQGPNVEIIYSTFDELPEHHKRVSEMTIERAKRLVEHKKDVTIFIDSITRLARAYNLTVPPSGRTLSGGLDPAALHMPKRFFGAARNMREGGSLTILATALVDTGSKMDDVVYEEFKGTGNMELILDRRLQEKRVFPAIDIAKSGTRREDLLLTRDEQEAVDIMRKALNSMKADDALENILNMFAHTRNNSEFVQTVKKRRFL